MFKIGDHIVYGTNGVCLVTDICSSPFDKKDARTYYILKPIAGHAESVIYTPVDNERVPMRALMSTEEVEELLARMHTIPHLPIPNEKGRREIYRTALAAGHPDSYIAVIKTILGRRTEFSGIGRRLPEFEIECDGIARRHLYTELSVVLGRPADEMEAYISERIGNEAV